MPDRIPAIHKFRLQSNRFQPIYKRMQYRNDRHPGSMCKRIRAISLIKKLTLPPGDRSDFRRTLKIAGLVIDIRSAWDIAVMNAGQFQIPRSAISKQKIGVHIYLTGNDTLAGPPIDPESDPRLAKAGRRGTASPLLRSRQVQACLNSSRRHADQLFMEILPEAISILDFKRNRASFFYPPGSAPGLEKRVIGPAMLAPFLPAFDACLLHASAIVRHGKAAVFLATGEGGKTTAARLATSGAIIGDDQVAVRRIRRGFRVSGTPWGLHVAAGIHAPLAGLFLLEKARRFALAACPAREMIASAWEEMKAPLSILPKPLKKKAFAILCEIAASVPAWKMSFPKDHIDWEAIDRALAATAKR